MLLPSIILHYNDGQSVSIIRHQSQGREFHDLLSVILFAGLGYCTLVVISLVTIYYQVIVAWTIFYIFASFTSELGWGSCGHDFNTDGESQIILAYTNLGVGWGVGQGGQIPLPQ
jgi:SNF family Na+-dependent transporter